MSFTFPDCPLPPNSTVWTYLRDSGGDTQDLASQRAYVLAYCRHHRLHLARSFEDGAISGGSVAGRDEFELMVELARLEKRPAVDGIVYWDIKRFARNILDSQFYKADLRRRGYKLISLSDNIPDNEFSVVFEAFLEWKAQKDREDISKDSRRGLRYLVEMKDGDGRYLALVPGKPPTCFKGVPYDTGLKRNNGQVRIVQRWIPDPDTWERGQLAWQMRADRASYDEIERATRLFPNPINPGSAYKFFFSNEIYIGRFHYGGQVYEDYVPALTTLDTWNRVQELTFKRPRKGQPFPAGKTHPKAGRSERYLLSGLCTCIYCQSAMHGSRNARSDRTRFWHYYLCAKKKSSPAECAAKQTSARKLEESVIHEINANILTIDFVGGLVEQVNALLNDTASTRAAIDEAQGRLRELARAIKNLVDMAELHPSPDLVERFRQREIERETEKLKLERLQQRLRQSVIIDEEIIVAVLGDMKRTLGGGEIKVRQRLLQQMVKKIEVGHDYGRLHCRFPIENLTGGVLYMPPTESEIIPCRCWDFALAYRDL